MAAPFAHVHSFTTTKRQTRLTAEDVLDALEMTFLVAFCVEMAVLLMALGTSFSRKL